MCTAVIHVLVVELRCAIGAIIALKDFFDKISTEVFHAGSGYSTLDGSREAGAVFALLLPALALLVAVVSAVLCQEGLHGSFRSGSYIACTIRIRLSWWYRTLVFGMVLAIIALVVWTSMVVFYSSPGHDYPNKHRKCCKLLTTFDSSTIKHPLMDMTSELDRCYVLFPELKPADYGMIVPTTPAPELPPTMFPPVTTSPLPTTPSPQQQQWLDIWRQHRTKLPDLPGFNHTCMHWAGTFHMWLNECHNLLSDPRILTFGEKIMLLIRTVGMSFVALVLTTVLLALPDDSVIDVHSAHFNQLRFQRSILNVFYEQNTDLLAKLSRAYLLATSGNEAALDPFLEQHTPDLKLPLQEPWSFTSELRTVRRSFAGSESDSDESSSLSDFAQTHS